MLNNSLTKTEGQLQEERYPAHRGRNQNDAFKPPEKIKIEPVFTSGKISWLYSAIPPENAKFACANKKAAGSVVTVRWGFPKEAFIHSRDPLQGKKKPHISEKIAELVCFALQQRFPGWANDLLGTLVKYPLCQVVFYPLVWNRAWWTRNTRGQFLRARCGMHWGDETAFQRNNALPHPPK